MSHEIEVRRLSPAEIKAAAPVLADILLDCVRGGASVSFMAGMTQAEAVGFWLDVAQASVTDGRAVLVAEDDRGILGTVQVIPAGAPNQPHRCDIAKMLVHRVARKRGVGAQLLRFAEGQAVAMERSLAVLDTVTGMDGERLYERGGWTKVGVIPDYALRPDGELCSTSVFYKILA